MMKKIKNVGLVWQDTRPQVLVRHPEWIVDALLSPSIDPSSSTVISGFWRSGTTWILESVTRSLSAKTVFEPLKPDTTGYTSYPEESYSGSLEAIDGFMPFASGENIGRFLENHLWRSLTGAVPGVFVRAARLSIREHEQRAHNGYITDVRERLRDAFRTNVVTKFTRGHLVLPVLQHLFSPTVIHIRRDPRAVVESLLRKAWSGWVQEMSLSDYLLTPEDGRQDVFARWADEIQWCDHKGGLAPVAGYWVMAEWYVDEFASNETIHVSFERLATGGHEYLNDLLKSTDIRVMPDILESESRTSEQRKTAEDRIVGWKDRLSIENKNVIEQTIHRFGKEALLGDD